MRPECTPFRDDIEAYALRALDAEEEARVRLHLRDCTECSEIAESYRLAVEQLSLAMPTYRAPARLRGRITGALNGRQSWSVAAMFQRNKWIATAAAAVVLAFGIGAFAWAISLSSEVDRLREQNQAFAELSQLDAEQRQSLLELEGQLNSARNEQKKLLTTVEEQATMLVIALDPDLIPSELKGTNLAPGANCDYVWSSKQSIGALTCKELRSVSFGVNYALWATKGDKTVAIGTFVPRTDGTAQLLVKFPQDAPGPVSDMWVTLERLSSPPRQTPQGEVILSRSPEQQAAR
jgi:hypothetical protein